MSLFLKSWIFLADKHQEIISQKQVPSAQNVFSQNMQKQVYKSHLESKCTGADC